MMNFRHMTKKEVSELQEQMKKQFGSIIEGTMFRGSKDKVYLGTEHILTINLDKLNAEGIGVYIGRIEEDGFRPSIEGAQLIRAVINVIEINDEETWDWIRGFEIKTNSETRGYVIIKNKEDTLGTGKVINGKIWNYTPKERRIKSLTKKLINQ